jgi:ParB family chromosome partitioning protein
MSTKPKGEPIAAASTAFDAIPEQFVPLNQIGIAPENLRADEGPDEDIPQLAETLFVAGQIFPLLVRPGRGKKEDPFMVLDGRRRRFGFQDLADADRIAADHPVRVKVLTTKDLQVAAAFLPNTEPLTPDLVDVISAVGRLQKRKFSPGEIAKALGRSRAEVQGWSLLAELDKSVLKGLRDGRISLRQAKLMTKLSADDQRQLADYARTYGALYDDTVRNRINGTVITVSDRRVRLAGLANYKAAGGRVESDLFGEMPDIVLDQTILQQVWDAQAQLLTDALEAEGVAVFVCDHRGPVPEGFVVLSPDYNMDGDDLAQGIAELETKQVAAQAALQSVAEITEEHRSMVIAFVLAALAYQRALHAEPISAVTLIPHSRYGVEVSFHTLEVEEEAAPDEDEEEETEDDNVARENDSGLRRHGDVDIPKVELDSGVSTHALNERYTDIATRGLLRALADDPQAALTLLVARLFANVGLHACADTNLSISTIDAQAYRRPGHEPVPGLDAEVAARLEARRADYLASGQRPIAWIGGLSHGERMTFLAELVAMTLNGREFATYAIRHGARAEAVELAELTGYDIRAHWTPDLDFFSAHNKTQLLGMLEKMGAEVAPAASLKKADLAAYVAEAAMEHHWAPDALSWKSPVAVEVSEDDSPDEDPPEASAAVPGPEPVTAIAAAA